MKKAYLLRAYLFCWLNNYRVHSARTITVRSHKARAKRTWLSVVCTLIANECASSQWSKCCGFTRRSQVSPQQILTTVMTRIVVDESTDNAKPHSMCLITISTSKKMFFFFDASSVVWTLIEVQRQISQSDCEISSNCGKILYLLYVVYLRILKKSLQWLSIPYKKYPKHDHT